MANSQWKIDNFISEVSNSGLAKPSRFEVNINVPICMTDNNIGQKVSMFCDQASFPPQRIITSRQQLFGPPSQHPVGVDYGGDGITLQFFVDREMKVKRFFDKWLQGIISPTDYTARYQRNYLTQISVTQLDESDTETYKVSVIDAFPISMQALTLDAGNVNTVHKLLVTFNYRRWIEEIIIPSPALAEPTLSKPVSTIYDTNTNIGPDFRGGYYGEATYEGGGGYDPATDNSEFIVT
jgi:hypothetical protein